MNFNVIYYLYIILIFIENYSHKTQQCTCPKHLYAYDLYTLYVNLNITQKISQVVIFYIQCIILGTSAGAAFWKVYGGGQESTSIVLLSLCRHQQGCRAGEFISQKLGSCHTARATQQRERYLPGNQQASLDLL